MLTLSDLGNYAQIASLPLAVVLWLVTAERFAAFWKKWRALIFLLLAIVGCVAAWRIGWVQATWQFATVSVSTSRWLFWLLVVVSFSAVVTLVALYLTSSASSEPTWRDYTEDSILGATWRWRYDQGKVAEPWCFCPVCDMVLVYSEERDWSEYGQGRESTMFRCERCNNRVMTIAGDKTYVIGRIKRHIDHAVRTDSWKTAVTRGRQKN